VTSADDLTRARAAADQALAQQEQILDIGILRMRAALRRHGPAGVVHGRMEAVATVMAELSGLPSMDLAGQLAVALLRLAEAAPDA
jgi:hypothetical protein